MGTSNFAYKDKLFVVEIEDEFDFENAELHLQETLNKMGETAQAKNKAIDIDIYALDKPRHSPWSGIERNFASRIFGSVVVSSTFMGIDMTLELSVLLRSGYYAHANVDYDWQLDIEGVSGDADFDADCVMSYVNLEHFSAGVLAMNKKHLENRLDAMRELAKEAFEHIGAIVGAEYDVKARFSNGGAMFNESKNDKPIFEQLKLAA